MIKAIVTNEMIQKDPPPPEIPPQSSMFSDPAMSKLGYYDKQIKWFMRQDIPESYKERLYQDMLTKATELFNNIRGGKPPPPPPPSSQGSQMNPKIINSLIKPGENYYFWSQKAERGPKTIEKGQELQPFLSAEAPARKTLYTLHKINDSAQRESHAKTPYKTCRKSIVLTTTSWRSEIEIAATTIPYKTYGKTLDRKSTRLNSSHW